MIRFRKLLLLGLLSCFIFLGNSFVNASACSDTTEIYIGDIHTIGGTFTSVFDSSFNVGVLSKGTVFSQTLGYGRKIFAPTSSRLFWRGSDGLPYLYFDDGYQGVPYYYHICDEITDNTSIGNLNCTTQVYDTGAREIVANFMSKVNNNDNWGYYMYSNYAYRNYNICISSHEIGKSVCFKGYTCSYNSSCSAWNCPLVNTKNYQGLTFTNLSDSDIGESPGLGDTDSGDSFDTSTGQYVELTGNLVYSDEKCTVGEIIDYAQGAGYNRYLCFGGLDNFDDFDSSLTYSPIPGTGKSLGQILANAMGTWDTPNDWFDFWNGLYQDRNNYTAMRESYPAVYRTWFDLYYQYGGSNLIFDSVNEYCTMISLVSDYTQLYNGTYFKNTCQNYIIPKRNSNSSDNVVGIDWGGVLGNSTGNTQMQSSKSFISNLFTKIKSNFRVPNRSDFGAGILPSYIIWALLGLIIFRFLSH